MMARKHEEFDSPDALAKFYVDTAEFPAGFMTQYESSVLVGAPEHQDLATGFPIGKRFKSAHAMRISDANPVHPGHHHRAAGRWRVYAFAAAPAAGEPSGLGEFAQWLPHTPQSPGVQFPTAGAAPRSEETRGGTAGVRK